MSVAGRPNLRMTLPILGFVMFLSTSLQAATWFVDANAPTSGQTGQDWDHPFVTIQQAISHPSLASGDEIRVAGGTYKPSSQTATINLVNGVSIKGGYVGYPLSGSSDDRTEVSILSGDLNNDDPTNYGDNAYTVVLVPNGTLPPSQSPSLPYADRANLDGFTITGARRSGGIRTQFTNFPTNASAIIRNCKIHNNYADFISGGVSDGHGGGVRVEAGDELVLRQCEIYENTAEVHGGGMYLSGDTILLNCNIHDNTAAQRGGGVKSNLVDLTVVSTTFENNEAISAGGALYCDSDGRTVKLINSLFIGNFVNGSGGAIFFHAAGSFEMTNCTVAGNSTANQFGSRGGGLSIDVPDESAYIRSSIFWDNFAYEHPEIWDVQETLTVTYSDIELPVSTEVWPGDGNKNATPSFVNDPNDYRLQCGSPCIDFGHPDADLDPSSDPDGFPEDANDVDENDADEEKAPDRDLKTRIVGAEIDMGAYEKQPPACPGDTDNSGAVNVDDLLAVINAWGSCSAPCPADVAPDPCGNGTVNVDDLLAVINNWGGCDGIAGGGFPETISECFDVYCAQLSGEDWQVCINRCVTAVCSQSPPPEGCE